MEEIKNFSADFLFLFHLNTAVVYEGKTQYERLNYESRNYVVNIFGT